MKIKKNNPKELITISDDCPEVLPIHCYNDIWDKTQLYKGHKVSIKNMRHDQTDGITYYTGEDIETKEVFNFIEYNELTNA